MISQELLRRSENEWRPFMEKLEKTVRRKRRVRAARRAALGIAAAFMLVYIAVNREEPRKSYLSAKIPLRNSPVLTVAGGGRAIEKDRGVWVVCGPGVAK